MTTRRGLIAAGALATYSFIPVKTSLAAACSSSPNDPCVAQLFAAILQFNKASLSGSPQDWTDLGRFLAPNVLLNTVSGHGYQGKTGPGNVIEYLQTTNCDQDQFQIIFSEMCWQAPTLVIGKAKWIDRNNGGDFADPNCPKIHYVFAFTTDSTPLIKRMIGTPDH